MEHWEDVAKVVNERMAERSISQQELAALSKVSVATLRKIQAGVAQRRTRGVLAGISRALGFPDDHLWQISRGEVPTAEPVGELSALRVEVADLARRVEALESRSPAGGGH